MNLSPADEAARNLAIRLFRKEISPSAFCAERGYHTPVNVEVAPLSSIRNRRVMHLQRCSICGVERVA